MSSDSRRRPVLLLRHRYLTTLSAPSNDRAREGMYSFRPSSHLSITGPQSPRLPPSPVSVARVGPKEMDVWIMTPKGERKRDVHSARPATNDRPPRMAAYGPASVQFPFAEEGQSDAPLIGEMTERADAGWRRCGGADEKNGSV